MDRSAPPAVISVRNLRIGYGERVLLENASFDVHRGEIGALFHGRGKDAGGSQQKADRGVSHDPYVI